MTARVPKPRKPTPAAQFTTVPPSVWQQSEAFVFRQDPYIDQERRAAVRRALALIVAGRPGYAEYTLARSVSRQARIAGLGDVVISCCPRCGVQCTGHAVSS